MNRLIDLYQQRREEREQRLREFFDPAGPVQYLIIPRIVNRVFTSCNSIEEIFRNNIDYMEQHLSIDLCDDLPYLEPWIGVGVYATAFGSKYLWNTGGAPDTLHRYDTVEEIIDLPDPDWRGSETMVMVLDTIDYMKEKTGGKIPICLTDTQSAQDTATLVLDTTEFLTACYTNQEAIHRFLIQINNLIIEFSHLQIQHIGKELLAKPGHGFHGLTFLNGIGVSDDNMVISSPELNARFTFPYNEKLGDAFGGIALHSCGNWTPTMNHIASIQGLYMIDFALIGHSTDAAPCPGRAVREAVEGTSLILKARIGDDLDQACSELGDLIDGDHKIIVEFICESSYHIQRYRSLQKKLESLFASF